MTYKPINFSLPGVGLIAMVSKRYEMLTDYFIQDWLNDLYCRYLVTPDYLLCSEDDRYKLHRLLIEDLYMAHFRMRDSFSEAERYPNKVTGHPLSIVVFPGLPEKTLFLASMLKMAHEEVQVKGSTNVVTRTYERL